MSQIAPMGSVDEIGKASGGYAIEDKDGSIYIPVVLMEPPGQGDGGRFLDSLPRDRTIKFPNVVSAVLAGMLERRGFTVVQEWADEYDDYVDVYVRKSNKTKEKP